MMSDRTMSDEREFMENLLNQRFNFFLVVFGAVLAGATQAGDHFQLSAILWVGFALLCSLAMPLGRAQRRLNLLLEELEAIKNHPITIIKERARTGGFFLFRMSMRNWIGYYIPLACCAVLLCALILSAVGILVVPDRS